MIKSSAETIITFVRHGHVYNPDKILYGRIPGYFLSEQGREEVKSTAAQLKQWRISQIYTSPMKRARESASIIAKTLGFSPKVTYLLTEVRLFCQGITIDKYHNTIQNNLYTLENVNRGQESIEEIAARMKKFTDLVLERHKGDHVVAISHGDPIVILKAITTGVDFTWNYKISHYIQPGKYLNLKVKGKKYEWS